MSSYIKELLKLKEEIKERTDKAIKNHEKNEIELLEKAKNKINKHYDDLLDSIKGYDISFVLNLGEYKHRFEFCSDSQLGVDKKSRYAISTCGFQKFILNGNCYGYNPSIGIDIENNTGYRLSNIDNKDNSICYATDTIQRLIEYQDFIDQKLRNEIELRLRRVTEQSTKKVSEKIDLIQTLENYIYNE